MHLWGRRMYRSSLLSVQTLVNSTRIWTTVAICQSKFAEDGSVILTSRCRPPYLSCQTCTRSSLASPPLASCERVHTKQKSSGNSKLSDWLIWFEDTENSSQAFEVARINRTRVLTEVLTRSNHCRWRNHCIQISFIFHTATQQFWDLLLRMQTVLRSESVNELNVVFLVDISRLSVSVSSQRAASRLVGSRLPGSLVCSVLRRLTHNVSQLKSLCLYAPAALMLNWFDSFLRTGSIM